MRSLEKKKIFDNVFLAVFSVFILVLFFALLSMNGLVLGNDPAAHLERTYMFLESGRIPLGEVAAWAGYPPLYHTLLATFIAFTGITSITQTLFLLKSITALINLVLILSVYLLGSRFLNKKCGAIASAFMLLLFPLYELNFWGGYTTLLSLVFMILLFLYLSLGKKDIAYTLLTFIISFSLFLSHQLTTFVAFAVLSLFFLFVLVRTKAHFSKVMIAAIFGGIIAFFIFYLQALIPHIDILISHVFFEWKGWLYQVPYVTPQAFVGNFGFVLFLAFGGILLAFLKSKEKKKMSFYLVLLLSFLIPLFLSQSYLFGIYWSYQRFIYYLLPSIAIFGAVSLIFMFERFSVFYGKYKWKKMRLRIIIAAAIVLISTFFLFHFSVVYGRIMEASVYYSTSDMKAFDAGSWLRTHYLGPSKAVVTEIPGDWLGLFSGKSVIAETNPEDGDERNPVTVTVLNLAHEIENPLTLVRAYEEKGAISNEEYVSINNVWKRVSYSSKDGNFISYSDMNADCFCDLSDLHREIIFEDQNCPNKITIKYYNDDVALTQTIHIQNESYLIDVSWTAFSLRNEITDITVYISTFFDLSFSFEKANIPGLLDWVNPWDNPSGTQGNDWAVVNFSRTTLADNYLGFFDEKNEVLFAIRFAELPDWGNVGVLGSRQIDTVRFQYDFDKINVDQPASFTYQILTFSQNSFPEKQSSNELPSLFDFKPATFQVKSRNYFSYINEENIEFIVYDKNQLDTNLIRAKILELIYSNDRYVIFRVKSNS
jgi:hypothetical protein